MKGEREWEVVKQHEEEVVNGGGGAKASPQQV